MAGTSASGARGRGPPSTVAPRPPSRLRPPSCASPGETVSSRDSSPGPSGAVPAGGTAFLSWHKEAGHRVTEPTQLLSGSAPVHGQAPRPEGPSARHGGLDAELPAPSSGLVSGAHTRFSQEPPPEPAPPSAPSPGRDPALSSAPPGHHAALAPEAVSGPELVPAGPGRGRGRRS